MSPHFPLVILVIDEDQVFMSRRLRLYLEGQVLQVFQQGLLVQEGQQVPGHLRAKIYVEM